MGGWRTAGLKGAIAPKTTSWRVAQLVLRSALD